MKLYGGGIIAMLVGALCVSLAIHRPEKKPAEKPIMITEKADIDMSCLTGQDVDRLLASERFYHRFKFHFEEKGWDEEGIDRMYAMIQEHHRNILVLQETYYPMGYEEWQGRMANFIESGPPE